MAKFECFDYEAHIARQEKRKTYQWTGTSDPDPYGLRGTEVILMREHEYYGVILASCLDSNGEIRCFTRLETSTTAWFPLDDLEPSPEPSWGDLTQVEKLLALYGKEALTCSSESGPTSEQPGMESPMPVAVSVDA